MVITEDENTVITDAPVTGTAPLKFSPPSKNDHVSVTALECIGVIT
jgi:hypothetical protein